MVARVAELRGEPPLTRLAYWLSAHECTLDISKARSELGYEPVPYPWHSPPPAVTDVEEAVAPLRRRLGAAELARYRAAGRDCASGVVETLGNLRPDLSELDVAGEVASQLRRRGFVVPVLLVAGAARQLLHRHPLPTDACWAGTR